MNTPTHNHSFWPANALNLAGLIASMEPEVTRKTK